MSVFTMNTELLTQAMKSAQKLTGAAPFGFVQFTLKPKENALHVHAVNGGTSVDFLVSTSKILEVGKKSTLTFSLEFQTLLTALAGHKTIKVTVKPGSVEFISGKYKAELNRAVIQGDDEEQDEQSQPEQVAEDAIKVPKDVTEFIRENLSKLALDPIIDATVLPFGCRANANGVFLAAYDNWHMSFVRTKKITCPEKLEFTLPLTSISLLLKEFTGGKPLSMRVTSTSLEAKNSVFSIRMALPAVDDRNAIPLDSVANLAASLKKDNAVALKLDVAAVKQLLDNIKSISTKGDRITFEAEGTECKVVSKGHRGKALAVVPLDGKVKKPVHFTVDFYAFLNLTPKMVGASVELHLLENVLFIHTKGAVHMAALHSEEKA